MGAIVRYLDSDLWTMELASSDTIAGADVVRLHAELREALGIGDRLRFHPLSALHEENIAAVRDRRPVAETDEVFGGVIHQPLTTGTILGGWLPQ